MPGFLETPGLAPPGLGFSVVHQKVELDIDFATCSLRGKTDILIYPNRKDLKTVRLNLRQCKLTKLRIDGKVPTYKYKDPYESLKLYGVHQHQVLREKLTPRLRDPPEEELTFPIPKSVQINELNPSSAATQNLLSARVNGVTSDVPIADATVGIKTAEASIAKFTPLTIHAEYTIDRVRDGFQFVGVEDEDGRYPHAYTRNSLAPGAACCVFPCVDDVSSRCTWEISIRCPRTLGDAFRKKPIDSGMANGLVNGQVHPTSSKGFSAEDEALDIFVVCTGEMTDEIVDVQDPTRKVVSFSCFSPLLAPQQVGFAVGPFEYVNLSEFRGSDEDDQLSQSAKPIRGYCLPGRVEQVRNTCLPMAKAMDFMMKTYGSYPFESYNLCFVDDLVSDTSSTASLSICSNRLLFPEDVVDPIDEVTRKLVHTLASQWFGINIIPKTPSDIWLIVGIAHHITDMFMKQLCGNNEFKYRQKQLSDLVCEIDFGRPSLSDMGKLLTLDSSELEFMAMKAPLVLYIMDRRLAKTSGAPRLPRIISKILTNAKVGEFANGALNLDHFQKVSEKLGHSKLDTFFQQWVLGAGCPRFRATQRFNKKKLVVEMMITQVQIDQPSARNLEKDTFMREVKEDIQEVFAGQVQHAFTGPMTIRIHEADGTPYEHIVEIKEAQTKFDIPYNTKYKRLKRSRRQKERAAAASGMDFSADLQEDVLLYCLGDVLQSEEEMQDWRLSEWSKEDEDKMGQESYEWIRMDADFEWICKMSLSMPGYMYLSQLQQDRDVVAQIESIQYMAAQREHPLISTIFTRTLMDRRYFHGIRTAATRALVKHAREDMDWLGLYHLEKAFQEMFCLPNSPMTRSNDFSDRAAYNIQRAILQTISQVRDLGGRTPMRVKRFLYDKLKFNDNSNNEFSDCYYISTLMTSICTALIPKKDPPASPFDFDMDEEDERQLERDCMSEIDRYRRMDEWTTSFQNIYSRTALSCQRRLIQAGYTELNPMHFMQYTRPGTFELLRVKAFENLVELGIFKDDNLLRWFILNMSSDNSPWVREQIHQLFGKALALVAIGDTKKEEQIVARDGLIIEQESSTVARQEDLARKQTVEGALNALKNDLGENPTLQNSLWSAANSPRIGLLELRDIVDVCSILYDFDTDFLLVLKYRRYWEVQHLGKGKLKFSRTGKFRTTPLPKTARPIAIMPQAQTTRKREDSNGAAAVQRPILKLTKPVAPTPPSPTPAPPPDSAANKRIKLKFKNPTAMSPPG